MKENKVIDIEKMKARAKFLRMFKKLPEKARTELVYDFTGNPMTLNVVAIEVKNKTKIGDKILADLGFFEWCQK